MTVELDLAVRLIAIGANLLLILILATGKVRSLLRLALIGLLIGSISYLLISAPDLGLPQTFVPAFDIFAVLSPFWVWLFARLLFEREPAVRLIWFVVGAVLAAWFLVHFVDPARLFGFVAIHLVGLALVGDIVFTAWSGRSDDLIERRRVIRLWLPLLVGAQSSVILVYELVFGTRGVDPGLQFLNSLAILALSMFAGVALLRTDVELLAEIPESEGKLAREPELTPSEIVLKSKLEAAMDAGFYRTEGLTIATLATYLETPEHRLRALINRRLGFRNFSFFLNRHRIGEARMILADRERVDLPVLTIAMDLGYNSLSTFNRAFRELTGQTPTEFRRSAIAQN